MRRAWTLHGAVAQSLSYVACSQAISLCITEAGRLLKPLSCTAGAYLDVVNSVILQKLLSNLEFNTSINTNGLSPRLAAQNPASGQKILSDISGMQYQSLLVIQEVHAQLLWYIKA